ncbi:hypothetical protein M2390_002936 [Mycetocola sp. BIGb0189]|uniref:hypothetical protein n=1 Tax=Mycetocola sp. BIGb0189 TaxID=2940604 RepID=UPI00216948D9|nr:hypothetical protein [Mycetocola sp. BIGb0189]MCS4277727.1 hypothetical protein [Mycetocola sp. BIGb0189]
MKSASSASRGPSPVRTLPTGSPQFDHPSATRLWADVTDAYDLAVHELLILEAACREQDIIDRLDAELQYAPLMSKGSMGQDVANPLLGEVRQHRAEFNRLLKSLDLDTAGAAAAPAADSGPSVWAV